MLFPDVYKPIRNFGYLALLIGGCALFLIVVDMVPRDTPQDPNFHSLISLMNLIMLPVSLFHTFLGVGLINKNRFWFRIFKIYLRCMMMGWPGIYLAKRTLKYIEENNIERHIEWKEWQSSQKKK